MIDAGLRQLTTTELGDDLVLREVYELTERAERLGRESMPFWTWTEFAANVRGPSSDEHLDVLGAYDGQRLVGVALCWSFLHDNTDKCGVTVDVDPAYRRRGLGRALLDGVEDLARADDRTVVMLDSKIPYTWRESHPHALFAAACGYRLSNYEVIRHLALPVPQAQLDDWTEQASQRHPGYTIETFVDGVPPDLAPGMCTLIGQLVVDAPTGEVDFEEVAMTPALLQEGLARVRASGRIRYDTLAIAPEGTVAAFSTLVIPVEPGLEVYQWGTFVHRRHRGRRLGLAVKVANLDAVQSARSDLTQVTTQNAEDNGYMVSINEQMGFAPVEVAAEFVKRL